MASAYLEDIFQRGYTLILVLLIFFFEPVKADGKATLASKIILASFVLFVVLLIAYHCYLKKMKRKDVNRKILSEECDPIGDPSSARKKKKNFKEKLMNTTDSPKLCAKHGSLHFNLAEDV